MLYADEQWEGDTCLYSVEVNVNGHIRIGTSREGFFDALRNVRKDLEKDGMLLCCFGASENVYPSGMQLSMGSAILAYKNTLGQPALRKDIVNIFDTDDSVKPSTVEQQKMFHERWGQSLR